MGEGVAGAKASWRGIASNGGCLFERIYCDHGRAWSLSCSGSDSTEHSDGRPRQRAQQPGQQNRALAEINPNSNMAPQTGHGDVPAA